MSGTAIARVLIWVFAVLVGAVLGIAGTIAHATTAGWFPIGLVVALIGTTALVLAVRLLTGDRWVALATGAGIVLATVVFSGRGPGGSVIVPETALGVIWTVAAPLLVLLVVAWPRLPQQPAGDRTGD